MIKKLISINETQKSKQINDSYIIPAKTLRWIIKVPVLLDNNDKIWIEMLADSAANKPCANLNWANKYFKNYICIDNQPTTLTTPNGKVTPKYCIYFNFPTKSYK